MLLSHREKSKSAPVGWLLGTLVLIVRCMNLNMINVKTKFNQHYKETCMIISIID